MDIWVYVPHVNWISSRGAAESSQLNQGESREWEQYNVFTTFFLQLAWDHFLILEHKKFTISLIYNCTHESSKKLISLSISQLNSISIYRGRYKSTGFFMVNYTMRDVYLPIIFNSVSIYMRWTRCIQPLILLIHILHCDSVY